MFLILTRFHIDGLAPPPQVDATASNLNSNDAFLLVTPADTVLWVGQGANETEKQGAQQLCDILGVSASELPEGGESGEEMEEGGGLFCPDHDHVCSALTMIMSVLP